MWIGKLSRALQHLMPIIIAYDLQKSIRIMHSKLIVSTLLRCGTLKLTEESMIGLNRRIRLRKTKTTTTSSLYEIGIGSLFEDGNTKLSFLVCCISYLEYELVPELLRDVGVPGEEVDDAPHDPAARRLARVDARRQHNHLLPVIRCVFHSCMRTQTQFPLIKLNS